ncbi:alpha/beta fold hydrolase BchO [Tropicimonas sp. IMCC34043]|uniref:alpha/beta fold hydrolase BchO n=1 Tax=Tropicimonas sp. IMCC34043 TaxID=2248760 RepID=UPI000E22F6F7|nr:alpha/beta fold hydrolase BchO [Tropicimonas sp. IMCC34043]
MPDGVPPDWPHVELSRIVISPPHCWHLQMTGSGPDLLLIHGAGGSAHSWRDLIAPLSRSHRVLAIDLPGQGFTRLGARTRCGLNPMSADIARLLDTLNLHPRAIVGHSAGAAIALRLAQILDPAPATIIGINAALENFPGVAGMVFPLIAKALALNPLTGRVVAATITYRATERLISGTGSHLTPEGIELYHRLLRNKSHVAGTLSMMEQWSLDDLLKDLPEIRQRVCFMTGAEDLAVSPRTSEKAAERMPNAVFRKFPDGGHLLHEEWPDLVSAEILKILDPTDPPSALPGV